MERNIRHDAMASREGGRSSVYVHSRWVVSLGTGLLLGGCAWGTPGCGDARTLEVLDEIVQETIQESVYGRQISERVSYEFRRIRTVARERDTERHQCEAELRIMSRRVLGDALSRDIEYDVYPVDDDEYEFMVEASGIDTAVIAAAMAEGGLGWPKPD